jgi:hypothetical protein
MGRVTDRHVALDDLVEALDMSASLHDAIAGAASAASA